MAKESKSLLEWRSKQKRGAIMKPSTFADIKKKAETSGASDPEKVAGAAYWRTAEAKHRKAKKAVDGLKKSHKSKS